MAEELLEKIPPNKCWTLTAKILTGLSTLRDLKTVVPLLGKGEGIISPVLGVEKWYEIDRRAFAEGGSQFFPWVKETFSIPVDDAIKAAELFEVASSLTQGPEYVRETIEGTPERVVWRVTKCTFYERWKEFGVDPGLIPCHSSDQAWGEEGLKEINPKICLQKCKLN